MKKIFFELCILFTIFILIISIIEWRLKHINGQVDILLSKTNNKNKILIIGNSHTGALNAYTDSSEINNSILNLSMANLELQDRFKLLQYAINNNKQINTIILGLDADQIGHNTTSTNYDRQLKRYGFELNDNSLGNNLISHLNFFRLQLPLTNLISTLFFGYNKETFQNNFIPFTNKKFSDVEACKKRAQEHSIYTFNKININSNVTILNKIIQFCNTNKVKLYFIQTPKSFCYSSAYNNNNNMQQVTKYIDSLALNNSVLFLNYLNNPIFLDTDFADFDHLNSNGTNKLLNIIFKKIIN